MSLFTLVWETVLLAIDTVKHALHFWRSMKKSMWLRRLLSKNMNKTAVEEIMFLRAVLDGNGVLVQQSNYEPLKKVRGNLWYAWHQLDYLAQRAIAERGDDSPETLSALQWIIGKEGIKALPFLHELKGKAGTGESTREMSKAFIDILENRLRNAGKSPEN